MLIGGDQDGGPGYQIRDEINLRRYETGTVGMVATIYCLSDVSA